MWKIILIALIAALGWCFYNGTINIDFANLKQNSIETMKKERNIKAINNSYQKNQEDINKINNGDL